MRIILDNIIFSLQRAGGISGAWAILVRELLGRQELDIRFLEREDARQNLFRAALDIPASRIITPKRLPLSLDRYMPVNQGGDVPFVFHSSYYRTCSSPLARNVVTLHDFIYEEAGVHPLLARKVHSWQKNRALRRAAAVVAVSETTRRKLAVRHPGIRAEIIHNPAVCTPSDTAGHSRIKKPGDYVLYVGGRDTYKNFTAAIRAAGKVGLPLHIAGAPLSASEKLLIDTSPVPIDVRVTEFPDTPALSQLYANALCLVYPSAQEGFGIPVIEAQAHGCPVIICPCPACEETAGGAAMVAEDFSEDSIADALGRLAADPALRQRLATRGLRNLCRFNPANLAAAHLHLYRNLLSE